MHSTDKKNLTADHAEMRESGKRAAAGQTHFWDFVFLKVIEPGDISFLLPKKKKKSANK